jgi:hypothetical protein
MACVDGFTNHLFREWKRGHRAHALYDACRRCGIARAIVYPKRVRNRGRGIYAPRFAPLDQRIEFHMTPEPNTGCWLWTGTVMPAGYGTMKVGGQQRLAHRVAYEAFIGPVPDGLVLDHLCRVRSCVNPWHLQPVTNRENILRGVGVTSRWARGVAS